jgi:hypothetical protein
MAVRGRFWFAIWLLAALGALWAVVARTTAGLRAARALDDTRQRRVQLEGRKSAALRRLGTAQSRAMLVPRAQGLGMRLPADSEIVILPAPGSDPR